LKSNQFIAILLKMPNNSAPGNLPKTPLEQEISSNLSTSSMNGFEEPESLMFKYF
jgi:hypothetical protein